MARDRSRSPLDRRRFLTGVAVAGASGAAGAAGVALGAAPESGTPHTGAERAGATPLERGAAPPSAAQQHAEFGTPSQVVPGVAASCGSDFMVDVLKSLGIEYVFANTASSFRGLQESVVNYARNQAPEFITCMHEESSVGMAHGYAKASGRPAAIFCHGTVGMQHAAMAMYNAWCDRVPLLAFLGNTADSVNRANITDWRHSAQDPAAIVRDFTKWDDQPLSLQGFAESVVRAYKLATTPPMEPVAIVADSELQEMELPDRAGLSIPRLATAVRSAKQRAGSRARSARSSSRTGSREHRRGCASWWSSPRRSPFRWSTRAVARTSRRLTPSARAPVARSSFATPTWCSASRSPTSGDSSTSTWP
jgi:hypothetical protein